MLNLSLKELNITLDWFIGFIEAEGTLSITVNGPLFGISKEIFNYEHYLSTNINHFELKTS